jgi:predicted RNase H-like HicB family nuclease
VHYPIIIEWGDDRAAIGIQIPDIPGAVTAGDTFEEAYNAAIEVAQILLQKKEEEGLVVPTPTSVSTHRDNPEFAGRGWGMLKV